MKNTERFSNRVENYVKYRPGYPKDFIDYLYSNKGFSKASIIADIGSGTGILSGLLLDIMKSCLKYMQMTITK